METQPPQRTTSNRAFVLVLALLSVVFIGTLGVFVLRGAWNALAT